MFKTQKLFDSLKALKEEGKTVGVTEIVFLALDALHHDLDMAKQEAEAIWGEGRGPVYFPNSHVFRGDQVDPERFVTFMIVWSPFDLKKNSVDRTRRKFYAIERKRQEIRQVA